MKLWIIYSKVVFNNINNAISWLEDEGNLAGFDTEIVFAEDLYISCHKTYEIYNKNKRVDFPDIALTRTYDEVLIRHLELAGVKTFNNSKALTNCLNKITTHQLLLKYDIPSIHTIYSEYQMDYNVLVNELHLPFILKDIYGKKGEQVFLIHNKEEYDLAIKKCIKPLFQEYIDKSKGRDVRVHVIGNKVVASVLRYNEESFKSNYSAGGSVKLYTPDDQLKDIAIRATKALGLDFSGVDILLDEYKVCEVNGVPGFRTIGLTSDISIPREMMNYIKESI